MISVRQVRAPAPHGTDPLFRSPGRGTANDGVAALTRGRALPGLRARERALRRDAPHLGVQGRPSHRRQFSAKVGTTFEGSLIGLDKWFVAI